MRARDAVTLRGRGAFVAIADLIRRLGVLRHPINVTRILYRYGGTLPAAIELGALRDPARVALVYGDETVSFELLRSAVHATATSLAESFPAGAKLGIRTDATPATVVLFAAAVAAGL